MTDFERSGLAVLAPVVDENESRALFAARRSRRRTRRRVVFATIAISCVALIALGTWAVVRDDHVVNVDTGLANQPAPDPTTASAFEVLAVQQGDEQGQGGTLRASNDVASLAVLWEKAGLDGVPPAVDFDRWVVVSMVIPEHACRPTLTGFSRDRDVLVPDFVEPEGPCVQRPFQAETFVVSIDRNVGEPMLTLRLPLRTEPPLYRGQPSIDLILDEAAARAAGLIPPTCVETDDASLCLGESTDEGRVVLRATKVEPGNTLTVTYPNGEPSEIPTLAGEVSTSFLQPSPGTMLRIHVAGTTADGRPIEGTIGIVG